MNLKITYWTFGTGTGTVEVEVDVDVEVRLHSPVLKDTQSIDILEKVQRRALNLISSLKGKNYEERLAELGLQSLKARRTRTDLI